MIKIQKPDRFSSQQNISESILSVTCPLPKKTPEKNKTRGWRFPKKFRRKNTNKRAGALISAIHQTNFLYKQQRSARAYQMTNLLIPK